MFIEIKGASFNDRNNKLKLLYDKFPTFPIKIIDGEVYKALSSIYKEKITMWEK